MFSRFEKFLIALMVALVFSGAAILAASAQDETPPPPEFEEKTCADCHEDVQMSWQNGPHSNATSDPIFVKAWEEQGKPGACLTCHVTGYDEASGTWAEDGVTCAACHTDTGNDHPMTTMSVDATPNTCGSCHTDTRFGLKDWEGSTHYEVGMDCSSCHEAHNASLKITINLKNQSVANDASQLCISCHEDASMNFPYSVHSQQGVTCIDCHLEHIENPSDVHQVADHSFKASIQTCNSCHAEQMHANGEATATEEAAPVAAVVPTPTQAVVASTVDTPNITPQPAPVSPLGYAGITALVGIAAGMLLAPWLERGYRLVLKKSEEVRHDGK